MNEQNARRRLEDFERAVARLEETLAAPPDTLFLVDATIQRFEFAFELSWKTMKGFLELVGRPVQPAPRAVFKGAYAMGWIDDEDGWIDLMKMRNATSHVYNEAMARDIHNRIRSRAMLLRSAVAKLKAQT
jgi:nucleotidyltransferase substrate binding protein (TIGR01987 family)